MQEQLHRAQANDAYWHGLFGGLYLPHLRRAIWNNLLALEATLDQLAPRLPLERRDLDHDGHDELFLRGGNVLAVIRVNGDALMTEFSSHLLVHNFGDTLRRHDEGYHDKLYAAQGEQAQHDGIASAHDRVAFRHDIAPHDAEPDTRPRGMFVDCWYAAEGAPRPLNNYREIETASFTAALDAGTISKRYAVENGKLVVHYRSSGAVGRVEIRVNIAMPSCDGYLGRYLLENGDVPCGFGDKLQLPAARRLVLDDGVLGGSITLSADQPMALVARPHKTVSQSEAGFEKIMQAVELAISWPLDGKERRLTITLESAARRA